MKKQPLPYFEGQSLTLEMIRPKQGRMPIALTKEGAVCLIQHGCKGFFEYNSIWDCDVVEVRENSLIVKPTYCLRTAKVNEKMIADKLQEVFHKDKPKHEKKVKFQGQYLRKDQLVSA